MRAVGYLAVVPLLPCPALSSRSAVVQDINPVSGFVGINGLQGTTNFLAGVPTARTLYKIAIRDWSRPVTQAQI